MKQKIFLIFFFFLSPLMANKVHWEEDYTEAVKISKKQNKPLLMFFTGTDWCQWCQKMSVEIFENPEFIKKAGSCFVFFRVEFPSYSEEFEMMERNQNLKEAYSVLGFPTVLLIDPRQGLISKLGYLPVTGDKYAKHLENVLTDYYALLDAFHKVREAPELERLYSKAVDLGCKELANKIFDRGLKEDSGPFFLLEQYTQQVEEGKIASRETRSLRIEIQSRDPKNIWGSHFRLAMLDFQTFADNGEEPEKSVQPLLDYIERFGRKDRDNLWRLQMMISQYWFSKGQAKDALYHARASYKSAPEIARKEIAESIVYLKTQLN